MKMIQNGNHDLPGSVRDCRGIHLCNVPTLSLVKYLFLFSMLQAILFDSDGVLVDTECLFFNATQSAFARNGYALTRDQWARWYLGVGKHTSEIAQLLKIPSPVTQKIIDDRNPDFNAMIPRDVRILPGVRDLLEQLARTYQLAVVTGASRAHFDNVHTHTGLAPFFETIVSHDDYEQSKPSPDAYLTALKRLALQPNECVAIEDSPSGAMSAVAAGIRCIVVKTNLTDITLCPGSCLLADKAGDIPGILHTFPL